MTWVGWFLNNEGNRTENQDKANIEHLNVLISKEALNGFMNEWMPMKMISLNSSYLLKLDNDLNQFSG